MLGNVIPETGFIHFDGGEGNEDVTTDTNNSGPGSDRIVLVGDTNGLGHGFDSQVYQIGANGVFR